MSAREKITRYSKALGVATPNLKKLTKRSMKKAERQESKALLDDAPTRRRYKGWMD